MTDLIASGLVGLTMQQPRRRCPVHGEIRTGWVQFNIGDVHSAEYCVRCAWETFERLGISRVSAVDPVEVKQ